VLLKTCKIDEFWLISQTFQISPTLKNKELVQRLQEAAPSTSARTAELLEQTISLIGSILSEGDNLSIQGFGSFEVKKKEERISVNPSTGTRWMIPPKLVATFKPGTVIKEKLKNYSFNEH
jgi:nucleoid DNA-binding protein